MLNPAIESNRQGLIIAAFLIAIAILGKVVTGLTVFGQPQINRLVVGVSMIPRSELGLVFAGVGFCKRCTLEAPGGSDYYDGYPDDFFSTSSVAVCVSLRNSSFRH